MSLKNTNEIETAITWTREEGSVGCRVLYSKERRVKFKVNIIVSAKFLNRDKILFDIRDVKDIC